MAESGIFSAAVVLAVSLTMAYLARGTNKPIPLNSEGQYVMRMHRLYQIAGLVSLAIAGLFIVTPFLARDTSLALIVISLICVVVFGGLGYICLIYYLWHTASYNDTAITVRSPKKVIRTVAWTELTRATFNINSGMISLHTRTGEKIKVSHHLVGFPAFHRKLQELSHITIPGVPMSLGHRGE